MEVKILDRGLT